MNDKALIFINSLNNSEKTVNGDPANNRKVQSIILIHLSTEKT